MLVPIFGESVSRLSPVRTAESEEDHTLGKKLTLRVLRIVVFHTREITRELRDGEMSGYQASHYHPESPAHRNSTLERIRELGTG